MGSLKKRPQKWGLFYVDSSRPIKEQQEAVCESGTYILTMNCRERLGIRPKVVTYDLSRRMEGARETKCSQFARAVARSIYDAQ
jgi:hypothetical protein